MTDGKITTTEATESAQPPSAEVDNDKGLCVDHGTDTKTVEETVLAIPKEKGCEITDGRTAASTGHVITEAPRPDDVSLGWGGYDEVYFWQQSGLTVTKDMVKDEKYSKERHLPTRFVNEAGEHVCTVESVVDPKDYPPREEPLTLYELLNKKK